MSQRTKAAKRAFKTLPVRFEKLDLAHLKNMPKWMTRCFRNNQFSVMVNDQMKTSNGEAIMAMIQKHDDTPIRNHWRQIQRIKNEVFGEETVAIEYYPAQSKLVDDHYIYWIWIYPEGVIPEVR